jgi:hypothetical protein
MKGDWAIITATEPRVNFIIGKNYPLQAGAPLGWRGAAIWRPTQLSGRGVTVDCQSRKAMPLWLKEKLCAPDTLIPVHQGCADSHAPRNGRRRQLTHAR